MAILAKILPLLALVVLAAPAEQAPPTDPAVTLARADSRAALAETVWRKRVAGATADPAKAAGPDYQAKLKAAESELAAAELELELANRRDRVQAEVSRGVREAVSRVRGEADQQLAQIKAAAGVMADRNRGLLDRLRLLVGQRNQLEHESKLGGSQVEATVRGLLGGIADNSERVAALEAEAKQAQAKVLAFKERVARVQAEAATVASVKEELADARKRYEQLEGDQRKHLDDKAPGERAAIEKKMEQEQLEIAKLLAMKEAGPQNVTSRQAEARGALAAAQAQYSLLNQTLSATSTILVNSQRQLIEQASDEERINELQHQADQLMRRKQRQARQIEALQTAVHVLKDREASPADQVKANAMLEAAGLPDEKLDLAENVI